MKNIFIIFSLLLAGVNSYSGSWIKISAVDTYSKGFNDFKCADSLKCLRLADNMGWGGILWKTTDGCQTWKTIITDTVIEFPLPARYRSISLPSTDLCYIMRDSGYVLRSTDFGINWQQFEYDKKSLPDIVMYDNQYGFMSIPFYEKSIHYFKFTTDGGLTWNNIEVPEEYKSIAIGKISIPERNLIILKATIEDIGGRILKIINNKDWVELPWPEDINNIKYINKNIGYAVGGKQISQDIYTQTIKKTTDGGQTWFNIRDTNYNNGALYQVYFLDEYNGLVVGTKLCLLRTSDGGLSWQQDIVDTTLKSLKRISLISPTVAYLMSTGGEIYKYYPNSTDLSENYSNNNDYLLLLPNPLKSGNLLHIRLLFPPNFVLKVQIFNLMGELIIDDIIEFNNDDVIIPKSNYLRPGLYYLKINYDINKIIVY